MRLKVTDGDLIIMSITDQFDAQLLTQVTDLLKKWVTARDLKNVTYMIVTSTVFSITVMSVNDVFEEQVLK